MYDNNDTPSLSTESIDKMTMELLMNRKHYKKVVAKTDPQKYEQLQKYSTTIKRYKNGIENIFAELLSNPEHQITHDVNESFDAFIKTTVRYLQMKDMEGRASNDYCIQDEDETMFDFDKYDAIPVESGASLWGKERVRKTASDFPLPNYFPKRR